MPSWKRVIVSGSNAALNSLTVSNGITGSLFGTASYASNGGVTQLLAGPNVTLSPTTGVGQVTISSIAGGGGFNTATGSYGSFYSTQTQTNVAGTARSMSFNTTDITNGVSISGSTNPFNTYIKTENAGVYDIQFSAQVDKTDSGTDEIWIWLRKNGTNLTDTATSIQLVGNEAHYVAAWNFFVNSAANDYYQLMWYSPDGNVRLHAEPAFGVVPGIPSVIATVNRVDQFLSNTGSFTGSFTGQFTGSLFGTASFASTASFLNSTTNAFIQNGNSFGTTALLGTNDNQSLALETNGSTKMTITSAGDIGINTTLPNAKLDVNGNVVVTGSLTVGVGNTATGQYAFSQGGGIATGNSSHAQGSSTRATGTVSHAEGQSTVASGLASHAEGQFASASGNYSHAEGALTIASGAYSHAEGNGTQARGDFAHAEGELTRASGSHSHAEGSNTLASNFAAHAEGYYTTASGNYSHAEGTETKALGPYSHAEGYLTRASQSYSHAEGQSTVANGVGSHAEGLSTVASGAYQHVQGQFNIALPGQSAFIIGNGTADGSRSNLVFASGSLFQITGSVIATQGFSGSLFGTSSWAISASNAVTASYALSAGSVAGGITGTGTDNYVPRFNGTSALENSVMYDDGTNIGIGTTSPTYKLEVNGTLGTPALWTTGAGITQWGSAGTAFGTLTWDTGYARIHATSGNRLDLGAGGGLHMTISTSGNVGIGTTTPTYKFEVSDGTRTGVINPNSGLDAIFIGVTQSKPLIFGTGDTERMRITSGGNVGIGTTNPTFAKLKVSGASASGAIISEDTSGTTSFVRILGDISSQNLINWQSGTALRFATSTQDYASFSEAMRITSAGNVGIGTTSPNGKLEIRGIESNTKDLLLNLSKFAYGTTQFYQNYSNTFYTAGKSLEIEVEALPLLQLAVNNAGSQGKVIFPNGNVGIGTTSPAYKLQVVNSGNTLLQLNGNNTAGTIDTGFTISADDSKNIYLYQRENASTVFGTNNTERMRIASNGAIKFNTYGAGTFTGTATQKLAVDSSGNIIEIPIGAGPVDGSGTTNYVTKWTDADTLGNSLIFDNGTNVGIGNTSPSVKLDVSGIVNASGGILANGENFEKYLGLKTFADGVANRAINVQFGDVALGGRFEITITGTFSNQNAGGGITKVFAVLTNPSNNIYVNESRVTTAVGAIVDNFAIGQFQWDSASSQYIIPISHIVSSGNPVYVHIKAYGMGNTSNVYNNINLSDPYALTALSRNYEHYNDRLGIGTASPSTALHIARAAATAPILRLQTTDSTTNGQIQWTNSTNTILAFIGSNSNISDSSGNLEFATGGTTTRMVINSSGNVGINTTTPSAKLQVGTNSSGDSSGDNSALVRIGASSAAGRVHGLTIANTATATVANEAALSFIVAGNYSATGIITTVLQNTSFAYSDMTFSLYNGSSNQERVRIKGETGNVGIGNTSPATILELGLGNLSNGTNSQYLRVNAGGYNQSSDSSLDLFNWSNNFGQPLGWRLTSATEGVGVSLGRTLTFNTVVTDGGGSVSTATERMRITSAGNVGIGTTSPSYKLDVLGDIGAYANGDNNGFIGTAGGTHILSLTRSTNNAKLAGYDGVIFYTNATTLAGGSERMRITSAGDVGIGTTSPNAKLDVSGSAYIAGNITLPQNPTGTTYGNGVSTSPPYMITQGAGDNDAIRFYAESAGTNQVSMVFEVNDDIETAGSEWIWRNKKTYGGYEATTPMKLSGAGELEVSKIVATSFTGSLQVTSSLSYNSSLSTSNVNGEIAYWGGGTVAAGTLYYYDSSGNWTAADADAESTSTGMLGIALAAGTASTVGILLRGHARFTGVSSFTGTTTVGAKLYVSTTAGAFSQTAPTGTGDVVRIIGYVQSTANDQIYFCPDTTWVTLL